jgi:hypothetical protein
MHELGWDKLNEVLGHFYMNARKQEGEHYKATSFQNIRHALNRHIQGGKFRVLYDIHFAVVRNTLNMSV